MPCLVGYWTLLHTWRRACKAVGQEDHRLYDLRHACGRWLSDAGVSDARIADHLRHKVTTTTRRYTTASNNRICAETLDRVMYGDERRSQAVTA